MSAVEQRPNEIVTSDIFDLTQEDRAKPPTALVYGSPEMIAAQQRLHMDRLATLGGSASQLSIEINLVPEAPQP